MSLSWHCRTRRLGRWKPGIRHKRRHKGESLEHGNANRAQEMLILSTMLNVPVEVCKACLSAMDGCDVMYIPRWG